MIKRYLSLHLHTSHSFGDAILKLSDYLDKAKELDLPAIAITNHGTMSDCYDLYLEAKEKNIKPIIGCEVYVTYDRFNKKKQYMYSYDHLILLAKTTEGFRNLLMIHNDAQINGFYSKPKTDIDFLKTHGKGIIALSACVAGDIAKTLLKPKYEDEVLDRYNVYKNIFDEFYLEIQPGNFTEQRTVNFKIMELEKKYGFPVVITNDVHYLNKQDAIAHDIHVCSGRHKETNEDGTLQYPDSCYYVMSNEDLYREMNYLPKDTINRYIDNIYKIIDSIEDYDIVPDKIYMPIAEVPEGFDEDSYLRKLAYDGLILKGLNTQEYVDRLEYELETIKVLGFSGYFLTVRDYINWSKNHGIQVGPGRGSVCGSLVAYTTGITIVNPLKYGLLFERFISIHRKGSVPDIDVDFDSNRRQEVFDYVVDHYGADRCCLVSTFALRHSKASIRDTGKVFKKKYGLDNELIDHVAKLIPTVYYIDTEDGESEKVTDVSIEDAIEQVPELKEYQEMYPEWFEAAIRLTNVEKTTSIHAAGTIIAPVPLFDKVPLVKNAKSDMLATALNLHAAESGPKLIKFDFLSLSTLGIFDMVLKLIGEKDFSFISEEYDDKTTWDLIGSKYTSGLFQVGTPTYKQRMSRLAPRCIDDLAADLSLVRGPCISSKLDEKYMRIQEGKEEVEKIHPIYDSETAATNGILIYQEQLMKICKNAGFSLEDGYKIMKAGAKKKFDVLRSYEQQFMELVKDKDMTEEVAKRIFKMIVDSGKYSFNKSHAVAYAIIVYISAYLKVHYEAEFIVACLTNAFEKSMNTQDLVNDAKRLGYKFLHPDINKSDWDFTVEDRENKIIRVGFCAIKSFGDKAWFAIKDKRPFIDFDDFLARKGACGKGNIIPAIMTDCFKDWYPNRIDCYNDFFEKTKAKYEDSIYIAGKKERLPIDASTQQIEEEYYGLSLVADLSNLLKFVDIDSMPDNFNIECFIKDIRTIKDKNKNTMAFLTLTTGAGVIEAVCFASTYSKVVNKLIKGIILSVNLKKNNDSFILNYID